MINALLLVGCASRPEPLPITDNTATWQDLPNAPVAVMAPAASISGRNWIVTGGIRADGTPNPDVLSLDLDTLQWSIPTRLEHPRFHHDQATLEDGRVLVIGGRRFGDDARYEELANCELITGDKTRAAADLPEPIATPTVHLLPDGRVLAVGGPIATIYDDLVNEWTTPISLAEPRAEHASLLLSDGTVLVAGGNSRSSLELIDPLVETSTPLAMRLPAPIDDLAMAELPDGRVWIVGGQDSTDGDTLDRTWIVDLVNQTLSPGPKIGSREGLADHLIVPTAMGLVVLGGESQHSGQGVELAQAYLVDPTTLRMRRLPDMNWPHDDAVATVDGMQLIIMGGMLSPEANAFAVLKIPRPLRETESLDLSHVGPAVE